MKLFLVPYGRRRAPAAVIGPCAMVWAGDNALVLPLGEVAKWLRYAARMLEGGAIFEPVLSARWGRLVACTPQFSRKWRKIRHEIPNGFDLEVTP